MKRGFLQPPSQHPHGSCERKAVSIPLPIDVNRRFCDVVLSDVHTFASRNAPTVLRFVLAEESAVVKVCV
jgi:hypothetical protein